MGNKLALTSLILLALSLTLVLGGEENNYKSLSRRISSNKLKLQTSLITKESPKNDLETVLRHKKELKFDMDNDDNSDPGLDEDYDENENGQVSGHRSKRSLWDWLFGYDYYPRGHYRRRWWPAHRHGPHWRNTW